MLERRKKKNETERCAHEMNMMDEKQPWQEQEDAMGDAAGAPPNEEWKFFRNFFFCNGWRGRRGDDALFWDGMDDCRGEQGNEKDWGQGEDEGDANPAGRQPFGRGAR